MINKQIAADLYKWDYKLVDKDGTIYPITGVYGDSLGGINITAFDNIRLSHFDLDIELIGTNYFILCRPLSDLTKDIPGFGKTTEKIIEMLGYPNTELGELCLPDFIKSLSDMYFVKDFTDVLRFNDVLKINDWLDANHFLRGVDEKLIKYI